MSLLSYLGGGKFEPLANHDTNMLEKIEFFLYLLNNEMPNLGASYGTTNKTNDIGMAHLVRLK